MADPLPPVSKNPPPPAGWHFMPQQHVTRAMTERAEAILADPKDYPLYWSDPPESPERVDGADCLFTVLVHPADYPIGPAAPHRGVSIYEHDQVALPYAELIDVSHYTGAVDWAKVRAAGVCGAFIKASEARSLDPSFEENAWAARAAGVLVGAYHFLRPELDAAAQAQFFLQSIRGLADQPGDLPPAIDCEVLDGQSKSALLAAVAKFSDQLRAAGLKPCVYTSEGFWPAGGPTDGDDLWDAHWGVAQPAVPAPWSRWEFWQYVGDVSLAGCAGNVDRDRFNGSEAALRLMLGQGQLPPPAPSFDLTKVAGDQGALLYLSRQLGRPTWNPGPVDGLYGPKTRAAVAAFQRDWGGLVVDGIVGPVTRTAILAALAKATGQAA